MDGETNRKDRRRRIHDATECAQVLWLRATRERKADLGVLAEVSVIPYAADVW